MIVLLTNDDGITAEGIRALRDAVENALPEAEIFTVAPVGVMSLVGHRVTTHAPIQVDQRDDSSWAVHGTPADCVRLALSTLLPKTPDWIFSGINHGGNMGQDIYISGTVAAVREAAYHGARGIAFSQYMKRGLDLNWDHSAGHVARILAQLLEESLDPGEHLNVNLPHLEDGNATPHFVQTRPEVGALPVAFQQSEEGYHYAGVYGDRPRVEGSDVHVCFDQRVISVSKLRI